jgi:DNA polymerase-3 subunit gamma/tau
LAQNCELRKLEDGLCLLRLSPKQGHLQMKPNPERLQQALADYLGSPVQLRIELADNEVDTPAATAGRQRQEQQERAASAIARDGFVRDAIDTLGASIVESSIKPIA